ncbi:MAG TPA: DoxX family protein, partial [Candidatus Angelobacter sp.]|nr:DoxX family protein [Candidatus Angelobacter sp.]
LDRKRKNYAVLQTWVRLFFRFALAGQMINYGMAKVIPMQMPYPSLTRLLQPFGTFSPMGVLWSSIGAAPAYEIFAGCAEVVGGLLLIFPRTATLGALVCLADMIQVFMLNMTYDVPVKLFAFHLILLACFLLARDVPRLAGVLFLDRTTAPRPRSQLFSSIRANRVALVAQIVLGLWLLALNLHTVRQYWSQFGGGRQYSALYGIWEVTQMSVDGQPRPPLLTDNTRWRRAIFDYPQVVALQRMDDSLAYYRAAINLQDKTLVLTKGADKNWKANLAFERPVQDKLIVDGRMEDHQIHMELQLTDRNNFLLVKRGFHLIQESAYNR